MYASMDEVIVNYEFTFVIIENVIVGYIKPIKSIK